MTMFRFYLFAFVFLTFCFISNASHAQQVCAGENGVSDGICVSAPTGAGALAGRGGIIEARLEEKLGRGGRGSISSFIRTVDNSPEPVQRFALETMASIVSKNSRFYDDFDTQDLRNFTSSLRSIRDVFERGFTNLPCAAGLGGSSLDQYTDYTQNNFMQSLQNIDQREFLERRMDVNALRAQTIETICSQIQGG